MIIASEKRKTNIAEFLLYMWQIEDLIRAYNLDIDSIDADVISKFDVSPEKKKEIRQWYESLIDMMRRENVQEKGHLQINTNTLEALNDLHRALLADPKFDQYEREFYKTLPFIVELRAKSGEAKTNEIETCFNALYGTLLMRLQGKEISEDTLRALSQISKFIGMLSSYFHQDEQKPLFMPETGVEGTN